MPPQGVEQGNEARACLGGFGMVCSKRLLTNCQGTSIPGSGLLVVALRFPQLRQIVYALGCVGVLRSQLLLPNVQSTLVEWLRFGILALLTVEVRQPVER